MTNKERLQIVKKKLEHPEKLGLLQHAMLIIDGLPSAIYDAKYRPDDIFECEIEQTQLEESEKPRRDLSAKEDAELRIN